MNKAKILLSLSTFSTVVLMVACTNKGGGGGDAPPPPVPVVVATVTPVVPPPNTGIDPNTMMSYIFNDTLNGASCTTGPHNVRYADYCTLLQDEAQNNSCAPNQRKLAYNRDCVNGTSTAGGLPGQYIMPAGSAAYCQVTGVEDEDSALTNRRRMYYGIKNYQTFIPWTGATAQSFPLSYASLASRYGSASLSLSPAQVNSVSGAQGQVSILQNGTKYMATSHFSSRVTFEVGNYETGRKLVVDCIPNSTLAQVQADITHVTCQIDKASPQQIVWDTTSDLSTDLQSRDSKNLKVELLPAVNGAEAMMQISSEDFDGYNDVSAKSAVRTGLQVSYKDRSTGKELLVNCSPASK